MSLASQIRTINADEIKAISSGIYILEMSASEPFRLGIKKFTEIILTPGYYYYTGSAQKNLYHRLTRHFRENKKVHWHIDHLTINKSVSLTSALILPNADKSYEWKFAEDLESHFDCSIPLIGFGNSDTNKTKSHLFIKSSRIPYSHFISRYQSMVRFIP